MLVRGLPNHQTTPINTTIMSKKRHTKEAQIKAIREHESGRSQAEICKELNITAQTFYRWKKQLWMMTNPDVRRLRDLEKENKELKQMLADGLLRERVLKIVVEKTLSPRVLRELLPAVMAGTPCSQRFACKVLGIIHGVRPDPNVGVTRFVHLGPF